MLVLDIDTRDVKAIMVNVLVSVMKWRYQLSSNLEHYLPQCRICRDLVAVDDFEEYSQCCNACLEEGCLKR